MKRWLYLIPIIKIWDVSPSIITETLFGELLVFRAGFSVVCKGMDADAAAWSEQPDYLNIFRLHEFDKVFHDDIHAVLMEIAMIAEAEQV